MRSFLITLIRVAGLAPFARWSRDRLRAFLFQARYGGRDLFELSIGKDRFRFATDDPFSKHWFYPRYDGGVIHEEPVTRAILGFLQPGMCFIDIGANLGFYSVVASKAVGTQGTVHAIELDKANMCILNKNLSLNACSNVTTHRLAIGESSGALEYLQLDERGSAGNQLLPRHGSARGGKVIRVPSLTLDKFCEKNAVAPDVIKIDVQGAELKILRGMGRMTLVRNPTLFCEVHPQELVKYGHSVQEVVDQLLTWGMTILRIDDMRGHRGGPVFSPVHSGTDIAEESMIVARRGDLAGLTKLDVPL